MAYSILTVRTAEFEDGALYPVLGDDRNEIEFEPLDGGDVKTLYASSVDVRRAVGSQTTRELFAHDIKMSVYVTDARVAVACTKFDKGGGWRGGSLAVPVLNAVSKARAAHRRRGKMLVGHIRYPWLSTVGFTERSGMGTSDAVRLGVVERVDGNEKRMYLDLTFPKGTDTGKLAQLIAQRAARYRLSQDPSFSDGERVAFEGLLRTSVPASQPKTFVFFSMPSRFPVNRATAYPTARGAETAATVQPPPSQLEAMVAPPVPPAPPEPPLPAAPPAPPVLPAPPVAPLVAPPLARPLSASLVPPLVPPPAPAATPPKWADDPYGRHELRYWDGARWSEHVSDAGVVAADPWPRT